MDAELDEGGLQFEELVQLDVFALLLVDHVRDRVLEHAVDLTHVDSLMVSFFRVFREFRKPE